MAVEGLIPFIFRKIKRKNIRRRYRCLTDGLDEQPEFRFYHTEDKVLFSGGRLLGASFSQLKSVGGHHRRHHSAFPYLELDYTDESFPGRGFSTAGVRREEKVRLARHRSVKQFFCIAPS